MVTIKQNKNKIKAHSECILNVFLGPCLDIEIPEAESAKAEEIDESEIRKFALPELTRTTTLRGHLVGTAR